MVGLLATSLCIECLLVVVVENAKDCLLDRLLVMLDGRPRFEVEDRYSYLYDLLSESRLSEV
jgi:hypothetical protein